MNSLEQFLVPKTTYKNKKDQHSSSSIFSKKYLRNNIPMVSFMISYIIINVILFTTRSVDVYMNTKNVFYMLAKASGTINPYQVIDINLFLLLFITTVFFFLQTKVKFWTSTALWWWSSCYVIALLGSECVDWPVFYH